MNEQEKFFDHGAYRFFIMLGAIILIHVLFGLGESLGDRVTFLLEVIACSVAGVSAGLLIAYFYQQKGLPNVTMLGCILWAVFVEFPLLISGDQIQSTAAMFITLGLCVLGLLIEYAAMLYQDKLEAERFDLLRTRFYPVSSIVIELEDK